MGFFENKVRGLLESADIMVNGSRPWDITVHNENLYKRVALHGSLGLGEAYMDGWWDCEKLDEFFTHILQGGLEGQRPMFGQATFHYLSNKFFNHQSESRAFEVGKKHYDIGNDLYKAMLDKRMAYTCAYWKDADNLDDAQEAKLDLICRKLQLRPGMTVLDIGCGWGSFAKYAAEKYGVSVTGITVSKEQVALVQESMGDLPVKILLQDYRAHEGKYDRIVSVGMFEHVGPKNYRTYMEVASRCLKDDGIFLLHTIGGGNLTHNADAWIEKYIFPNGILPQMREMIRAIGDLFVVEDWHNFGPYYDKTLMAWHHNFESHWNELKEKYGERFKRMWDYYLLCSAASFRVRHNQLWQIVLTKKGISGGYESIR